MRRGLLKLFFGLIAFTVLGANLRHLQKKRRAEQHARNTTTAAFYFWKTRWTADPKILEVLKQTRINTLYLRLFDVEWELGQHRALPVASLELKAPLPGDLKIIPVVFLKNEVFQAIPMNQIKDLAHNVWNKVSQILQNSSQKAPELQLDCDWSLQSQSTYFKFLTELQKVALQDGIPVPLSATIRLHQVKYFEKTGIPPVARGMLMFYNLGKLASDSQRSSIYNKNDALKYVEHLSRYPLPLDLALPVFEWAIHIRNGEILGLIEIPTDDELRQEFIPKSPTLYGVKEGKYFHGIYYGKNDTLRLEHVSPALSREAAELAIKNLAPKQRFQTVAFFDIDDRILERYENYFFDQILSLNIPE